MTESQNLPVYRKDSNGERVRVPGDIKDPKRRYSHTANVQTGEQYLMEFTDEEERQRDAEEHAWEASRPQREAEAKRQEEEAIKFRESLRYENRIVAFLDVLGWEKAIADSQKSGELTQKLGIALQGLASHVDMVTWQRQNAGPGGWPGDPMMTQFSDSLLISFADDRHAQSSLEMLLSALTHTLFIHGFVVRGAITQGELIHRASLTYGPALVTAYKLESSEAIFPRIILDRPLGEKWGPGVPILDRDYKLLGHDRRWRQDDDTWYFFDHLSYPIGMRMSLPSGITSFAKEMMHRWGEIITLRITENLNSPDVLRKYVWLARYYNKVCQENPGGNFHQIRLPGN